MEIEQLITSLKQKALSKGINIGSKAFSALVEDISKMLMSNELKREQFKDEDSQEHKQKMMELNDIIEERLKNIQVSSPEIVNAIENLGEKFKPQEVGDGMSFFVKGVKGDKGEDGKDGINGKDGLNGLDGKDGLDGLDGDNGKDGINGIDGKDGINGKDGNIDTPQEIADKLNTLESAIEFKVIKGLDYKKIGKELSYNDLKNKPSFQPIPALSSIHSDEDTLTGTGNFNNPIKITTKYTQNLKDEMYFYSLLLG